MSVDTEGAASMAHEMTGRLFDDPAEEPSPDPGAPLAERMRPTNLDEFVGQDHLVGGGALLRRLISERKPLPSLILWGGPGTGKTTLARLLANSTGSAFIPLSAVFAGVREVRASVDEARRSRRREQRTVLFIDEIHRFSKVQQDALLPAVEDGTVTLIGATTENPSFELTGALLSRSRVLVLHPLTEADIEMILCRALSDAEQGLAGLRPDISAALVSHLARASGGDARGALSALEAAVDSTPTDPDGRRRISEASLTEALGRARFAYDRQGEDHYNLASTLVLH